MINSSIKGEAQLVRSDIRTGIFHAHARKQFLCERSHLRRALRIALISVFVYNALTSVALSSEDCPTFPSQGFMSPHSHGRLAAYVARELNNDWYRLDRILRDQIRKLRTFYSQGQTVELRLRNSVRILAGSTLDDYIRLAELRLKIARCISSEYEIFGYFEPQAENSKMIELPLIASSSLIAD